MKSKVVAETSMDNFDVFFTRGQLGETLGSQISDVLHGEVSDI
jgi:hypothetical protein